MAEITKSNFSDFFPTVARSIKNCSFVAIDAEFTGLTLGPSNESNLFDSMPERYEKLRARATSFIPCQIGLSTFTKDLENNSYFVDTFVFYVRPYMFGSVDRKFTCQASAIDFLSRYNFDFNKFLSEGIPYLNDNEVAQALTELKDGSIGVPHEKLLDQRCQAKQHEIINQRFRKYAQGKNISNETVYFPIDEKIHVYFQLRELRRKFPKYWAYGNKNAIQVNMVSWKERQNLERHEYIEKERVLHHFLGFTRVFRVLKNSQKPIVGHNLLMDLMLFYQNFHQNLPDSYDEFKKEMHEVFPVIYDTKYIWMNLKKALGMKKFYSDSNLTALYELFKSPPDYLNTLFSPSVSPLNCKQYVNEEFVHDSGYDAFITGYVFLKVCHLLAMGKPAPLTPKDQAPTYKHLLNAASPFVNKINFAYSRVRYMNLDGPDPLAEKLNFLHISFKDRTKSVTLEELHKRFSKYQLSEFKFTKLRNAAVVTIVSEYVCKKIMADYNNHPELTIEEYDFLKHSPYVDLTLWLTGVTAGCLVAVWIWKNV